MKLHPPTIYALSFFVQASRSAAAIPHLSDATCALQTATVEQQLEHRARGAESVGSVVGEAASSAGLPDFDVSRHLGPTNTSSGAESDRVELPRTLTDCSTTATIHIFQVEFSYMLVATGLKFVYTLSPAPSPPADAPGVSSVTFSFPTCTCTSPDMFSSKEVTEETSANPAGAPVLVEEDCDENANGLPTELTLSKLGDRKGDTYIVGLMLGYPILGIGKLDMTIQAGGQNYSASLCAPLCTPPPTPAPTASPTSSATSKPTLPSRPTPPLPPRTPTPTPATAAMDEATSFGDPHVGNLQGQRFNILRPGNHTFLAIPRGAEPNRTLLHVVARIEPVGPVCHGLLYITGLTFTGRWLGAVGSLELSTMPDGNIDARRALWIKAGGISVDLTALQAIAPGLATVSEFRPERPGAVNRHATTLLVTLNWGLCVNKVRLVYQKEKTGFSNSLWFAASGLKAVHEEIGGILGLDDHTLVATRPGQCLDSHSRAPAYHFGSVHAVAAWSEEGGEEGEEA